jgi:hypothetical protein
MAAAATRTGAAPPTPTAACSRVTIQRLLNSTYMPSDFACGHCGPSPAVIQRACCAGELFNGTLLAPATLAGLTFCTPAANLSRGSAFASCVYGAQGSQESLPGYSSAFCAPRVEGDSADVDPFASSMVSSDNDANNEDMPTNSSVTAPIIINGSTCNATTITRLLASSYAPSDFLCGFCGPTPAAVGPACCASELYNGTLVAPSELYGLSYCAATNATRTQPASWADCVRGVQQDLPATAYFCAPRGSSDPFASTTGGSNSNGSAPFGSTNKPDAAAASARPALKSFFAVALVGALLASSLSL